MSALCRGNKPRACTVCDHSILKDPVQLVAMEAGITCCDMFEKNGFSPLAGNTVSWTGAPNARRVALQAVLGPCKRRCIINIRIGLEND